MQTKSARSLSQIQAVVKTISSLSPVRLLTDLFISVIDVLINFQVMNRVWRERRELELLTDEHIQDIGLNPDSVRQECKRSFFDVPHNRKRTIRQRTEAACRVPF